MILTTTTHFAFSPLCSAAQYRLDAGLIHDNRYQREHIHHLLHCAVFYPLAVHPRHYTPRSFLTDSKHSSLSFCIL